MYNYVNRTTKTSLIKGIPFSLFISLQLHYIKRRKAVKRRWVRGFTGIDEEMDRSAKWRKLAQNEKKNSPMVSPRFPQNREKFPQIWVELKKWGN